MTVRQDEHTLERHAIGLPAVTAQSAALIAPAAGSFAGLAFIVGYSGAATPLAFLIGLLVCVCVALVSVSTPAGCRVPAPSTPI